MEKLKLGTVEDGTGFKASGLADRAILIVDFWA